MQRTELDGAWQLIATAPDAIADPSGLTELPPDLWRPAPVPGTVAAAVGAGERVGDLDGRDWWYRRRFAAAPAPPGQRVVLGLDGLATLADVYLNGEHVLYSESMFAAHTLEIGDRLGPENEIAICLRALAPRLAERRRPRARWRTRVVSDGNLRFFRTMLLGRAPGFAPGPPVVGPWRPVWVERRPEVELERVRVRSSTSAGGARGWVSVTGQLRASAALPEVVDARLCRRERTGAADPDPIAGARLSVDRHDGTVRGQIEVDRPELWWPHTHGVPTLHDLSLHADGRELHRTRIGFRALRGPDDLEADGLALSINEVPIFLRGVVWTPLGLELPHADADRVRPVLEALARAGMNMVRIPGTAAYESDTFHDACDELGILVLQDFMFANLDYPASDEAFRSTVAAEAAALLDRIGHRPSLAAICGGSDVAQQVAMLGLDPSLAHGPLSDELLPRLVAQAGVDAPYIPSAPWGGDLPFRTDAGVANYYGVGAYRRDLTDARRAEVRFATECLAFANVPDDAALAALDIPGGPSPIHPAWKAGVPRDVGAGWDFDDVRDHYLGLLYGVDPVGLRSTDPERYLALSRAVTGEVMAEVLGEWRRDASPCRGALILWSRDLRPGAGWGVLDHRGEPKLALHHVGRALAPVAIWMVDEGLNGIAVHVANDRPDRLAARLELALYGASRPVAEAAEDLEVEGHGHASWGVEALLGHFVDASYAYRFGPPGHDLVVATLTDRDGQLLGQAFAFPAGRPGLLAPVGELGLEGRFRCDAPGEASVVISSRAFAYGVRIDVPGHRPAQDGVHIAPGGQRTIRLHPTGEPPEPAAATLRGSLTALNLRGRLAIAQ